MRASSRRLVLSIALTLLACGTQAVYAQEAIATAAPAPAEDSQQAQAPPPPQPEHTGFAALIRATGSDFVAFPKRKSTWVILGAGLAGAAIAHPFDDNITDHTFSKGAKHFFVLGKYLGGAPVEFGVAGGLYLIGRYAMPHEPDQPRTNKLSHLGFDLVRAQIVSGVFVQGIKIAVRRDRPTGACCAFPSGHSAAAFATASVLERHLGYRAAWPTMIGASYVAISRLADRQHFLSDVVFGAAIGTASGWTVVGRHGRSSYALMPVPVRGGVAVVLVRTPVESRSTRSLRPSLR